MEWRSRLRRRASRPILHNWKRQLQKHVSIQKCRPEHRIWDARWASSQRERHYETHLWCMDARIQTWQPEQRQSCNRRDFVSVLWSFFRKLTNFFIILNFRETMGRFTMMINDRTSDIGCALVKFTKDDLYHVYFTCNYGSNNKLDQRVYETGSACSNCLTGCNRFWTALCSPDEKIDPNHYHIDSLKSFNRRRRRWIN